MQRHTFLLHLAWDEKCFLLLESNIFAKGLNPEVILKKRGLVMIVGVNVVPNRTVVVDKDRRFNNLCGSHLQSQSQLYLAVS